MCLPQSPSWLRFAVKRTHRWLARLKNVSHVDDWQSTGAMTAANVFRLRQIVCICRVKRRFTYEFIIIRRLYSVFVTMYQSVAFEWNDFYSTPTETTLAYAFEVRQTKTNSKRLKEMKRRWQSISETRKTTHQILTLWTRDLLFLYVWNSHKTLRVDCMDITQKFRGDDPRQ